MEGNQRPTQEDVFSSGISHQKPSSRLHFSLMDSSQSRLRPSHQRTHTAVAPPIRRGSPLNPQNVNQTPELRRRALPSDTSDSPSRSRRLNSSSIARIPDSWQSNDPDVEDVGAFSNEYDLAHEDPRILQDVQRALQLKARREARVKRETFATPEKATTSNPETPSPSHAEAPVKLHFPNHSPSSSISASPVRKSSNSTASDVDFSPSTGLLDLPPKSHPVPTSLDNGISLDWTGGSSHEGERRWTKSIVKKKDKDILPPLGLMIDEQEQMHKEKLARINNLASAQTARKAHITSEQLSRRYSIIYDSLKSPKSFNLVKVTKWYSTQPEVARRSLERAEPFTWLKHLELRSGRSTRSPWNLTALIMEEYVQTQEQNRLMTIPEDSALSPDISYKRNSRSPSYPSQKPVPDDRISFEPLAESKSKRSSWDAISLRSADSTPASVRTSSSIPLPAMSPASSRMNDGSKDVNASLVLERARSPRHVASDDSEEDFLAPRLTRHVPEVSVHPPPEEGAHTPSKPIPGPIVATSSTGSSEGVKPLISPMSQSPMLSKESAKPKSGISAPNTSRSSRRSKKIKEQRERQLRLEYDAKSILLAEAIHHNSKIRQLLNRISTSMKDYDSLQNVVPDNIRGVLPNVPKDLIDAFGHDPAGVTGSTRRMQGWRAVEDIYHRVHRQRQIFRCFLESFKEILPNALCPLDKPIETLEGLLQALKIQKAEIVSDVETVSDLLKIVQDVHGNLKDEYNQTVSHVSVVYPQLSHVVALEESYRDQYQQFWELGMDALTLLLDTVTPFWRHYGKTIGEDVRDFLIIPLYRNEFTGEPKRYRIRTVPTRSCRHWLWLGVFFVSSIGVNILQVRAAISSTIHFRLSSIPYEGIRWTALPFFWISIIIQWVAVLLEFVIVFMELGVLAWWVGWTANLVS